MMVEPRGARVRRAALDSRRQNRLASKEVSEKDE
jgi:hypothetical protein